MIKKRFKEYFTYTKKERNGLVVLLLILFILVLVRIYQTNKSYGELALISDDFKKDIETFEKSLILKEINKKDIQSFSNNQKTDKKVKWSKPELLFNFDPNEVSHNQLKELGFTETQINTLINYRKKGGVFYKKKDLLKIYGVNQEQYDILVSYIFIKEEINREELLIENEILELNKASKDDLMGLNGIGSTFAERIVKYRDLLGGFYRKEQIMAVYGMDSTRYLKFYQDIIIDTNQIVKLNINEVDFKTLVRHPYVNKYQTKSMLKYRELVGDFTNIEQIHQNNLLLKDEFLKMKPYLKVK